MGPMVQVSQSAYDEMKQKADLWDGLKTFIQGETPEIPGTYWRTKMGLRVLSWVFGDGDVHRGKKHGNHPFLEVMPKSTAEA